MPFTPSDLYLTSGTAPMFNRWQDTVYKYDSSSFYNWEQDNEPNYDLEDRTTFLWEKIGYPVKDGFSGIPGRMYCVSAGAGFAGDSSGFIFKSVSAVLNTLPNPIPYPVIIEIASFGNLGELNLNNIKIDGRCPGAGLEIINRNYARTTYNFSSPTTSAVFNTTNISSIDLTNYLHTASAICTSTLIASANSGDTRWNSNNFLWAAQLAYGIQDHITDEPIFSLNVNSFDQGPGTNMYPFTRYSATDDPSIANYDVSVVDSVNGSTLIRPAVSAGEYVFAAIYGNYFTKVSLNNCGGPIFLRNLLVNGASGTGGTLNHYRESGFEIDNSDIVLENCAAIRCSKEGFLFRDSLIDIRRSLIAARNYSVSSGGSTARNVSSIGAGVRAINSQMIVTPYGEFSGVNLVIQSIRNDVGFDLVNASLAGGNIQQTATVNGDQTFIQAAYNTSAGIKLVNSVLAHNGRIECYNNTIGIESYLSYLALPQVTLEYNAKVGILAKDSDLILNPDKFRYIGDSKYRNTGVNYEQFHFHRNGQHLVLDNSILSPLEGVNMPNRIGKSFFLYSMGSETRGGNKTMLPSIVVNNAQADFIHSKIETQQSNTVFSDSDPVYGACIFIDNGNVKFKGSINGATYIIGPAFFTGQKNTALVYACNGSVVEFNGNTLIGQGGVDVLADTNSVAIFRPHTIEGTDSPDSRTWNLSSMDNHTRIELHSTRACLVADNNSEIIMENLGDYRAFWPASLVSANDFNLNDAMELTTYVSSGSIQFYPNGQDATVIAASSNRYDLRANSLAIDYNSTSPGYFLVNWSLSTAPAEMLKYSTGGMCVRALGGSKVKVLNCHFPAGWYNTSSAYYDVSAGNCEQLRIWNIGHGSKLEASYFSVSGQYPSLAGYYGPSAVYLSAGIPASAAPAGTPNTGSLSVLDVYGVSGATAGRNYGPFRLFFGVEGPAKMLGYVSGSTILYGTAHQAWAQGYNPSGPVSANTAFSSVYDYLTSAVFLYVSSMVSQSYRDNVRLDESAANSFANAKHCALARSGRIPLVTIYRATSEPGGEAYDSNIYGYGKGLLSTNIFDLKRDN